MTAMTFDSPRRFPWPALLSVALHGALVAGLLYISVHQPIEIAVPSPKAISVTMVSPQALEPPQPAPEPVAEQKTEPQPAPEPPKEAPVVIHKPQPKPRPKPKPKPEAEKKVATPRPVRREPPKAASPFSQSTPAASTPAQQTAPVNAPAATVSAGPKALRRNQPQYPARAYALHMEGKVRVKFDVARDGSVENIEILSAKPANMFEREVIQAMRRWRYESGKPGKGLIVNIVFRINGGASMQ